ncbi:MAG: PAS domain-containing sensor histidine kinase [Planctomycetota bacterium]|nr:MAG: PAS domain-containing sensor histidine kinase [Planctomycetota bacterium]
MEFNRQSRRHGGVFWRLFFALVSLSAIAIAVLTWLFSNAYEDLLWRHVRDTLRATAAASGELLAEQWPGQPSPILQANVAAAADRASVRLTLISSDGRVLADSGQESVGPVRQMENHGNRPEIVAALRSGEGSARRPSPTLAERLLYVAVRVGDEQRPLGVVRAAAPLAPIEAEIIGVRRWLYAISALLAVASAAIAYWIARRVADPVRELSEAARALVGGEYGRRLAIAVPSHADADEVAAAAVALHDIGKRLARSERQLRNTSQTQATILDCMTESVIAVDSSEHILFANAAAGRSLGFDPARVNGRTLLEAIRSHELRDLLRQAIAGRKPARGELTSRVKPPGVFDVLATPLAGDPPAGVVLVLRDISELKRLERMRQQFIANVSHELKTPLSSIRAYAETLRNGAASDPVHGPRFLERIDEQAGRLEELILDMLNLARIEAGQTPLKLVDVPLAGFVKRCIADFETQAAAKQISISVAVEDALAVHADEKALRQVLGNLVDNAVKYTPAGGRVAIRACRDGERVLLEVEDTGPGIPPAHHARLFERFYRVDNARSRQLGGTGLGLAIVKHLTQAMGGSVALESQVGVGSVFMICLPAGKLPPSG